eukprot:TRINITY_DN10383_c0_g1_i1.p1 TRINITY_DN10383_c0_g1~~TRINITY_DN10383_c0_g1_i1.p1  ORF type:complete len:164 (-),score=61.66 TRINITY_DN10383_c0_g1_i1:68-559(-)
MQPHHVDILESAQSLVSGEKDYVANTANISSLVYNQLNSHSAGYVNWVGFYFVRANQLVLGPFMGLPACIRIPIGKGVCGTTVEKKSSILVKDVHQFPGHIACDSASESEIVVPIVVDGKAVGVFDIDSPHLGGLSEGDLEMFEKIVEAIVAECDWQHVLNQL